MGHVTHHAIVVTSYSLAKIEDAHTKASSLNMGPSPLLKGLVNAYLSFLVPPDGSKEGWSDSTMGDDRREEFKNWLRAQAFDDGSSPLEWVEIAYGSDDEQAVVADSQWPSPSPSLSPPEPPKVLCANDLYKIEPVSVTYKLDLLLRHVGDQVPYSSDITDLASDFIQTQFIDTHYCPERDKSWDLATIWFMEKPVMIIQSTGTHLHDHKKRFITDSIRFRKMCEFLRTFLPYEDVSDDIIDPTTPNADLYTFAGGALNNFATVD